MDLSFLKWPLIILVVVAVIWLMSAGGVNYMHNKFTQSAPGQDAQADTVNESGLSKLGGFLLYTFRYEKADVVLTDAVTLHPGGENYWYNMYRLVKCAEKQEDYQRAVSILHQLMAADASQYDSRVPTNQHLELRAQKLTEIHLR